MHWPHIGIATPKAHTPLRQDAPAPICAREAVIEYLSSLHTSLLDLAERKLGLFFGFSLRCGGKGRLACALAQKPGGLRNMVKARLP
jgi:hypothetical protein